MKSDTLNSNDVPFISERLRKNELILFVGAGFSIDAQNSLGKSIPTSIELSEIIWPTITTEEFDRSTPLQDVYQAALFENPKALAKILQNHFACKIIPEWYSLITEIPWNKIYTTNIDDLIEQIYRRSSDSPKLDVIDGVHDDYKEQDTTHSTLQLIKLNGKNLDDPDSLTFTDAQYGKRSAENHIWYDHLVRDYINKSVIFVGSRLKESPFYAAIAERGKRIRGIPETRPRSFLIRPGINRIDKISLGKYNIKCISLPAEDFFTDLCDKLRPIPDRFEIFSNSISDTDLGQYLKRKASESSPRSLEALQRFFETFRRVKPNPSPRNPGKFFLLGAEPTFDDIEYNLDAPRSITNEILALASPSENHEEFIPVIVSGSAGAGKTTILMRIALELRRMGKAVFYSDLTDVINVSDLELALEEYNSEVYLVLDNLNYLGRRISDFFELKNKLRKPLRIVGAIRSNKTHVLQYIDDRSVQYFHKQMPDLDDKDILSVIGKLGQWGLLGTLARKSHFEQIDMFRVFAKRQLLVAMMSATLGKEFDRFIEDEYVGLENIELRILYLATALATSEGRTITYDQLQACTDINSQTLSNELNTSLTGLIFRVGAKNNYLRARHQLIAEHLVNTIADRKELAEAYIRLLQCLSHDLDHKHGSTNRVTNLYQALIHHKAIFDRFKQDMNAARSIYSALEQFLRSDFHFWLQYGSLEIHYDELDTAENYLAQARALKPSDDYVATTIALLYYRRACKSKRHAEGFQYREAAKEELSKQFSSRPSDDFPVLLYLREELNWITTWISNLDQKLEFMRQLKADGELFVKSHKHSNRVYSEYKRIESKLLELAAPDE